MEGKVVPRASLREIKGVPLGLRAVPTGRDWRIAGKFAPLFVQLAAGHAAAFGGFLIESICRSATRTCFEQG
jgi:hypothetical protein